MPTFTNLGDLIVRDRDMAKIAVIDLGGEIRRRANSAMRSSTPWRTGSRAR